MNTIPELIQQLKEKNKLSQAANELIHIGAPAIDPLINLFETGDESLKILSADLLSEIGKTEASAKKAIPILINALAYPKIKIYALQALREIKPATSAEVIPLISALKHQNTFVRVVAAWFLGDLCKKAIPAIPQLITSHCKPAR